MGLNVCRDTIGHRAAFGDAAALGLSVLEHDKSGRAAEEVREVYRAVMKLLTRKAGQEAPVKAGKPAKRAA